jgi:tryptophan synthase alpha chain
VGRIEDRLSSLKQEKKKAIVFFLTAGYPKLDSTGEIALALERGGADILEIGMPFSDPLADGPAIQESSNVAIKNGVTLLSILDTVRAIRAKSNIPLVLMGYLNPILRFGEKDFFTGAAQAGVDGIILPELPYEETSRFKSLIEESDLSQILLVTPTTSPERIRNIDAASNGFLYCVSTTGVTGSGHGSNIGQYLDAVRKYATKNPLLVGFGISTHQDAASISKSADGIIIGSALIKKISSGATSEELTKWVRGFRRAVDIPF